MGSEIPRKCPAGAVIPEQEEIVTTALATAKNGNYF